jgi:glycosyltransferase involved in cell wall biosynthesis
MENKVEILISAMHQKDFNLFYATRITTDALMINQSDIEDYVCKNNDNGWRIISTTERGLSRSRNKAIENAKGGICLICDDDEVLYDGYASKIQQAYSQFPDADIICFKVLFEGKSYSNKSYKIGYLKALRVSSVQMTFRLKSIMDANVRFDTDYGSGTPMGSGEENIFMYDCLKKGLRAYYVPIDIGEVKQVNSKWFRGFTEDYFWKRGKIIRRMMGCWGCFYLLYFAITKYRRYRANVGLLKALNLMLKGWRERYV